MVAVGSGFGIVGVVEIGDEAVVVGGALSEALLGLGPGDGAVGTDEEGEEAEVFGGFSGVLLMTGMIGDRSCGPAIFWMGIEGVPIQFLLTIIAVEAKFRSISSKLD